MFTDITISLALIFSILFATWYGYVSQLIVVGVGYILERYLPSRKAKTGVTGISILITGITFAYILIGVSQYDIELVSKEVLLLIAPVVTGIFGFIGLVIGRFIASIVK